MWTTASVSSIIFGQALMLAPQYLDNRCHFQMPSFYWKAFTDCKDARHNKRQATQQRGSSWAICGVEWIESRHVELYHVLMRCFLQRSQLMGDFSGADAIHFYGSKSNIDRIHSTIDWRKCKRGLVCPFSKCYSTTTINYNTTTAQTSNLYIPLWPNAKAKWVIVPEGMLHSFQSFYYV